jgi:putative tryptophan/tyrosine transport system substrate-binding protein
MKRREFITLVAGAAAAWPLAARAQQSTVPVIGFLSSLSHSDLGLVIPGFHQGLNETGFLEGRTVAIEYRWAEGDYHRLPSLSADLVNRKVAVLAAISGTPAALAAKAATTTIPIVFAIGGDPIAPGLVTSLSRPGGNVTGVSFYSSPVVTKRLDLARELVPRGSVIAALQNPENPPSVEEGKAAQAAAAATRAATPDCQCQQAKPHRRCLRHNQGTAGPCSHRKFRPLFLQRARQAGRTHGTRRVADRLRRSRAGGSRRPH